MDTITESAIEATNSAIDTTQIIMYLQSNSDDMAVIKSCLFIICGFLFAFAFFSFAFMRK